MGTLFGRNEMASTIDKALMISKWRNPAEAFASKKAFPTLPNLCTYPRLFLWLWLQPHLHPCWSWAWIGTVIAHQDDGVNSLGFKEVFDQVIFFLCSQSWLEFFLLNDLCFDFNLVGNSAWLLLFKAVKTLNYRLKQHMLQTEAS